MMHGSLPPLHRRDQPIPPRRKGWLAGIAAPGALAIAASVAACGFLLWQYWPGLIR